MNTRKTFWALMAVGMIGMSAFAVQAQRVNPADLIRIKNGDFTPIKTVQAPSKSIATERVTLPTPKAIVGSWLETVTFTGNVMPPLKSMSTFTTDGGLVVADQGAVSATTVFSPGHGTWNYIGGRTFAWTSLEIMYDPTTGALIGYLKVSGEYTTDATQNSYTGGFFASILDPDGNVLFSVDGTNEGSRILLESLP